MGVILRRFQSTDLPDVARLLSSVFGSVPRFDRLDANPLGPPIGVVAEMEGAIVGFNQWIPWRLPHPSANVVYQSGSSAVAERARGLGLFGKMLRAGEEIAATEGVTCFIGFPNPASTPAFLKNGWTQVDSLALFACSLPGTSITKPTVACPAIRDDFARWRYEADGVFSKPSGRDPDIHVVYRVVRQFPRLCRVLDIRSSFADRPIEQLNLCSRALPVGSFGIVRLPQKWRQSGLVPIQRKWETPVIVRPLAGGSELVDVCSEIPFMFGDIDVG